MQADHSGDACKCRVCLGEWPEPVATSNLRLVSDNQFPTLRFAKASGIQLEDIYKPITEASVDIDECLARLKDLGV